MSNLTLDSCVSANAVPSGWQRKLAHAFAASSLQNLKIFLHREADAGVVIYPDAAHVLRALRLVDYPDVKVVILGQDPYHGDGQANGLAFAVNPGVKPPPSLKNIFKEISADLGVHPPSGTSLEGWAKQGVLLLNSVLSVSAHEAFSHRGKGWEPFTESIVRALNEHPQPLVFMLWGAPAQQKEKLITNSRHLILKAAHPSPLSAHRGFLGCRHFSQANAFLAHSGRFIDWIQTD